MATASFWDPTIQLARNRQTPKPPGRSSANDSAAAHGAVAGRVHDDSQTGVNDATLKRHYGQWLQDGDDTEIGRFEALDRSLLVVGAWDEPGGFLRQRSAPITRGML